MKVRMGVCHVRITAFDFKCPSVAKSFQHDDENMQTQLALLWLVVKMLLYVELLSASQITSDLSGVITYLGVTYN